MTFGVKPKIGLIIHYFKMAYLFTFEVVDNIYY